MTDNDIGRKIRDARLDKGYTQQELASRVGVDISSICHYERGSKNPSLKSKYHLQKVLGIDLGCRDIPKIIERRIARGYTSIEFAKILGISHSHFINIEKGRIRIPNKIIPKLNQLLGTDFQCVPQLTGDDLRQARIAKGRTQTEVAIAMKVAQNDISSWELGIHKIPEKYTEKLVALLSIPTE
jgi:transcriptional regulator with XRE-family HTH domain